MRPRPLPTLVLVLALAALLAAGGGVADRWLPSLRAARVTAAARLHLPIALDTLYPGAPWIHVVPPLPPLPASTGVEGLRAADCGKCHERHYQEWRQSTHAAAYTDLQLQSELGKPTSPRWLCLNCHIPVDNQRDVRISAVRGGDLLDPVARPNPAFDAALRDEGVTCAACHLQVDEAGHTYMLGSVGGTSPPHPVRVDRAALVRRCYDCHDQTYQLTATLSCYFQSGRELRAGPYAGDKECVSCHLPPEQRPLTRLDHAPVRTAHRHGFIGGGVPKRFDLYDAQLALGFQPALDVTFEVVPGAGGTLALTVHLTNARAGHMAPTGDPERHYLVEAQLLGPADEVIAEERLRIGQVWEWEPVARQVFDNRIAPREERRFLATLTPGARGLLGFAGTPGQRVTAAPDGLRADVEPRRVRVAVTHVRLSPENAAYMKRTADRVDPRFAAQVRTIDEHYPMASVIYRGELALEAGRPSGAPTIASPAELVGRSKARATALVSAGRSAGSP